MTVGAEQWPGFCIATPLHMNSLEQDVNYTDRHYTAWALPRLMNETVVAQSVRAFALHAEGWVFKSQLRHTYIVKTRSDNSTAKLSAIGVSVMGFRRWLLWMNVPCHSLCGTLKILAAQWPWLSRKGQNLQPFTGNGNVLISMQNARMRRETPNWRLAVAWFVAGAYFHRLSLGVTPALRAEWELFLFFNLWLRSLVIFWNLNRVKCLALKDWGPFHQKAYACRNSTTIVYLALSQIEGLITVSSKGVT